MIEERLLGFDARERLANGDDLWDAARRETFLLRVDVPKPLSVDTVVWPSLFDTGQGIGFPAAERERLHLAGLPTPSWIGPNVGLWDDLARMRQYLAEDQAEKDAHALAAVCWFSDRAFSDAGPFGPHLGPTLPPERDPAWQFLGFDVADGSLVSGLTNCGYSPAEAQRLRRRWATHLNESHLFGDLEPAFRFRDSANRRVPEHAPFFVYGLFLLEKIG